MQVGLLAHPSVRWLVSSEPDLHARVVAFIQGRGDGQIDVAGPPSATEIIDRQRHPNRELLLPKVTLRLRMVKHSATCELGVEIKCSDEEIDEIVQWARQAKLRTALAAQAPN